MSKVFLELLNISIMTGWVVLVVVLLRVLLKKAPAWVRCALWSIVGLRLVWPFHISSPVSLIPSRHTLPYGQLYDYTPELNTGIDVLDEVINPGFTQAFESEIANSVNPLQVWLELAGWVWLLGMVVMAVYAAVSFLRLRRRVAVSMPLEGRVYLCDRLDSPFILGLFRPKIYLPSGCEEAQKAHILAHENCHLARKDHWWKPLGFALLTVHWFNPLLWLAYILLCRDMELACDERVIAQMSQQEKREYSGTLLECSADAKAVSVCPLAFGEVGVKQRIKAVLDYKKPVLWIVIAAIVVCAIAAVCLLTEPVAKMEQRVGIMIDEVGYGCFYGTDLDGTKWCVYTDADVWLPGFVWITHKDNTEYDWVNGQYTVAATDCWQYGRYSHIQKGGEIIAPVEDICEYDIDGDGIIEQCILSGGPTSGLLTFSLTVWNGSILEDQVVFVSDTSYASITFGIAGNDLILQNPDFKVGRDGFQMKIYDVAYRNGKLTVLYNGESLNWGTYAE